MLPPTEPSGTDFASGALGFRRVGSAHLEEVRLTLQRCGGFPFFRFAVNELSLLQVSPALVVFHHASAVIQTLLKLSV